jgi:site-specific recombinase XerD
MFDPKSVRFSGPFGAYVLRYWRELLRLGYAQLSAANLLRVAAHFSRWLEARSCGIGDITDERIAAFMRHRRRLGYTQFLSERAVQPLLRLLRAAGLVPTPAPIMAASAVDRLIEDYVVYLARERGLAPSTMRGYGDFARRFIAERPAGARLKWKQLKPAEIAAFVLREARRWSVGQVKNEVSALRSLLRYLHVTGRLPRDLADCVPAVAGWRLSGLPKALEPDQVQRVLETCDLGSPIGRRDAAMIRLLVRLGLRAGDVAALTLDDLDWRAGEITLRGKGGRESHLPLPRDVGHALVAYVRSGRPRTSSRRVFIGSRAPYMPLSAHGVVGAVGCALRRAGIAGGAHLLRHTAATQMLHGGASLPEIGHVLRHRHLDTTAIYAKVDFAALRTLAQPWPGGVE